jgi:hypothetical protein
MEWNLYGLIIVIIVGITCFMFIKRSDKVDETSMKKLETEMLKLKQSLNTGLIQQIEIVADMAVIKNMELAQELKQAHTDTLKLAEDEIKKLNESAKDMINKSLPKSLMSSDGMLNNIIGGEEKLNTIISGMIEKSVFKNKKK